MNLSLRSLLNLSDRPALSALRRSFFIAAAALGLGLSLASACDSKGLGQETCSPGETKDVGCNTCICEGGFFSCTQGSCYEPCANRGCGDLCTLCDPNDKDCVETDNIKVCDPQGVCGGTNPGLCVDEYDPCADKLCGASCTECAPDDPECAEDGVIKACDPDGKCVAETEELCGGGEAYDPCEDKSCGDHCFLCPPEDPECTEDAVVKACDPDGICVAESEELCGGATHNPCEGKSCGDSCTLCPPDEPECIEPANIKACDPDGICVADDESGTLCGDTCEGKSCGDQCFVCPQDADCVCDPDGICVAETEDLCINTYDPCGEKLCGEQCTLCDPEDPECTEDDVLKGCSIDGFCVPDDGFLCR